MQVQQIIGQAIRFMEATEGEIIQLFSGLSGAKQYSYLPGRPIIFVPGTRKDRVLLVAHYDTVWMSGERGKPEERVEQVRKVKQYGMLLQSGLSGTGIGADDRLGVLALWACRKEGHSLLLVPDEEIGCLGSGKVADSYPEILKNHQFMLQFDRRGAYDLVFYNYFNEEFLKFLRGAYHGYSRGYGSCTDIVKLIPASGICGVNISIGFHSEHAPSERVDILDYIRTIHYTKELLRRENLPSFPYAPPQPSPIPSKERPPHKPIQGISLQTKITSWTRTSSTTSDTPENGTGEPALTADQAAQVMEEIRDLNENPDECCLYCEDRNGDFHERELTETDRLTSKGNLLKIALGAQVTEAWCTHCKMDIPPKGQFYHYDGSISCLVCDNLIEEVRLAERNDNTKKNIALVKRMFKERNVDKLT